MPKVIMEFQLPEEEHELLSAQNGHKWEQVVWDLEDKLRNWNKYGPESETVADVIMAIRKEITDGLEEYGLSFY